MRYLRRALTGVFLFGMTLGALAWAVALVMGAAAERAAEGDAVRDRGEIVYTVRAVTVTPGTERPVIESFGEIVARREADLRAGVPGRVLWRAPGMREGGQVAGGDLLARIDPAEAQAALESAQADLAEAQADLDDARVGVDLAREDLAVAREQVALRQQALDRQRGLGDRGVGSASAVEEAALAAAQARAQVVSRRQALAEAEAQVARIEARVTRARIALREAERRRAETEIIAPFDGTLIDVALAEGMRLSEGEVVGRVVDTAALDVAARLSAAQYARLLDAGGILRQADVRVILDAGATELEAAGRIDRDAARVGEGGTGRDVFATLDRASGFKPGDIVTVRIREAPLDGVARLPARAVSAGGEVLVIGPDDRLRAADVAILRRQADSVLVRAGGLAGADIVARLRPELGAGIKVRRIGGGEDALAGDAEATPAQGG